MNRKNDTQAQQSIFSKNETHSWIIHIDGASRNNPGKAGAGIVMKKDGEVVSREGFYLGIKTNNQAEYYALLLTLFFVHRYAHSHDLIRIASDSELLVKQMAGSYKIKHEGLKPLFRLAQSLMSAYTINIMHVVREDNVEADAMANKGIDSKKPVPTAFIAMLQEHGIEL
jgi:ribonuclease HI